jgi:hypothetical protein
LPGRRAALAGQAAGSAELPQHGQVFRIQLAAQVLQYVQHAKPESS